MGPRAWVSEAQPPISDLGEQILAKAPRFHNFLEGSEQWHFLRKDLAAVDRKRTPWLVFAGHRPMYSSSATQETSQMGAHLRQAIEPLLAEFKVDIALWGHVHK